MIEAILDAITVSNLSLIFIGVVWGIIFGAIPGLTATLAIVVLIPITYGMSAVAGISTLIGVYIGAISGGMISAILLGMPGTPSSIATTFDGFPMAKKGLGEKALGVSALSNTVGALIGWIFLVTLAPQIARLALNFGPFELVALFLFAFTAVISLSGKSLMKGLIMTAFGLLLATMGLDPTYSMPRNTFGLSILSSGISTIPAMIGLFVISQVLLETEEAAKEFLIPKAERIKKFLTFKELRESIVNFIRSGVIGTLIGILPGIGGALSNFLAYDQAKKASKNPDSFGQGNIQGLVASETANNASVGGALIPMLSLGIPGDQSTAALLGGLMLHGLNPGPLLIRENPEIVNGVFVSYIIASIFMFAVLMVSRRLFPTLLRIKKSYLLPLVLAAGLVGCYNMQYSISDVWLAILFGIIGYFLVKNNFPLTPVVISVILGSNLESNLRLGLLASNGSLLPLFTRPLALLFMALAVISLGLSFTKYVKVKK